MTATRTDGHAPPTTDGRPPGHERLATLGIVIAAMIATLLLGIQIGRGMVDEPTVTASERSSAAEETGDGPARLTWAPPELEDPATVHITEDNHRLTLDDDSDYILVMPDEPLEAAGGVVVDGGRNVVMIGGEIHIGEQYDSENSQRGLYLVDQTGTIHVEGLHISGDELTEGINLDQREGATVQLQNIRVETVHGSEEGHHADVIQTWAGPSVLRVDGLTGSTGYQGLFLLPKQFIDDDPRLFHLRNINLAGEDAAYLLWRDGGDWPIEVDNVWVSPSEGADDRDEFLWARGDDTADTWDDVRVGQPPGGDFVPAGMVGVGYESPGYLDAPAED